MGDIVEKVATLDILYVNVVRQVVDQASKKIALGFELFFEFLQCRDVPRNAEHAGGLSTMIPQRQLRGESPRDAPVGQRFALDLAEHGLSGGQDGLLIPQCSVGMLRQEEIMIRFSGRLARMSEVEMLGQRAADACEAACGILEKNAVGQVVQQGVKQIAFLGEGFLGAFPLDGVSHGVHEQARVHEGFDQVVLGALLHRLNGEPLVVEAAHHDDRQLRSGRVGAPECLGHRAVGQRQVEQHELDASLRDAFEPGCERRAVFEFEDGARGVSEVFAHEARVARIVLDEQDLRPRIGNAGVHAASDAVCASGRGFQFGSWRE